MTDCCEILISVRREYARKMLSGAKTAELRRRQLRVAPGTRIWIYSKAPQAAVLGQGIVEEVVVASPATLWKKYRSRFGVSYAEFVAYFGSLKLGCAVLLRKVKRLKSEVTLEALRARASSFQPPQFYVRLSATDVKLSFLKTRL